MRDKLITLTLIAAFGACSLALAPGRLAAQALPSTEGYVAVDARAYDQLWLRPGVDLAAYSQVRIEPVTVEFSASWLRLHNRNQRSLTGRLKESDLQKLGADLAEVFDQAYPQPLADADLLPGGSKVGDVLRVEPQLIAVHIRHPDLPTPTRTDVLVENAGEATLLLRLYAGDAQQMVGWALERRETRDHQHFQRANRVFNRVEFRHLFQTWGRDLARLLAD